MIGCRRRSTYPLLQDFRCDGDRGPPCTLERGDTVFLDVDWMNPGLANMTQSTVWVSWIELPWVGMETEACPFLDAGQGCRQNAPVNEATCLQSKFNHFLMKILFQARQSKFKFPIYIQEMYPTGIYLQNYADII